MNLLDKLINKEESIAVIGLGYVGLPLGIAYAKKNLNVIGFDLNLNKIKSYREGVNPTNELDIGELNLPNIIFTANEDHLKNAKFHIVAVPTPINTDKTPDLTPVINASEIIGRNLTKGSIVVYESTVYPGVTEDICIPILEKFSGMTCGVDFKVGYSPERINPGDKENRLENTKKVVSAIDNDSLKEISKVYELIIEAGVFQASSIKVAEAAKVVENSQRDINIAFMNELSIVFNRMGIDTYEVIEAMNTKWNALGFYPGLVGGHCISVDPYYFIYQAEKLGYHSQIIMSGRKLNDSMGQFIADSAIKKLVMTNKIVKQSRVAILGFAFKENCSDIRNTKIIDVINRLREYGIDPIVVDPLADAEATKSEYNIDIVEMNNVTNLDCLIIAVAHDEFKNNNNISIGNLFREMPNNEKVIIDVKSILNKQELVELNYCYWRM